MSALMPGAKWLTQDIFDRDYIIRNVGPDHQQIFNRETGAVETPAYQSLVAAIFFLEAILKEEMEEQSETFLTSQT